MRSLGTRRAFLATGVAAAVALVGSGCSAGQVAETALKRASNPGVNVDNSDRTVSIRNLSVQYPGTAGYAAGADAPLELGIYNQTKQTITVLVSSRPSTDQAAPKGIVTARQVGLVSGGGGVKPAAAATAVPEPSGSADDHNSEQAPSAGASASAPEQPAGAAPKPPAAAARPGRIEIAPLGSVTFHPGDSEQLVALGLTGKLMPGNALNLVFEFSNGAPPLVVQAPVGIPLSPASRGPAAPGEHAESEEQDNTHG